MHLINQIISLKQSWKRNSTKCALYRSSAGRAGRRTRRRLLRWRGRRRRSCGRCRRQPLGLGLGKQERRAFSIPFHETDTLLLYTDGLIERRAEDIDVGQKRLTDACSTLAHDDLQSCLADLVEKVRDHTREDDVAALAARRLHVR